MPKYVVVVEAIIRVRGGGDQELSSIVESK